MHVIKKTIAASSEIQAAPVARAPKAKPLVDAFDPHFPKRGAAPSDRESSTHTPYRIYKGVGAL
jgi:hypothetical protein